MKFGVCYDPESWPASQWAADARQMRGLGLSIVRVPFTWNRIEPEERRFAWGWLDQLLETIAGEGLQIVLGTPTATPPPWLSLSSPDILPVDERGRRQNFGDRHYCPNSRTYRTHTRRIVTALAERYGQNPHVIGWQIDDEFGREGTRCYCHECLGAFRIWVRHRYGSLPALNEAWGMARWGEVYTEWDQLPFPLGSSANPSHALDYLRFVSDSYVQYQHFQIGILKSVNQQEGKSANQPRNQPNQFLTHNFMGPFFHELDYFDLATPLDFVSLDNVPMMEMDSGELYGEGIADFAEDAVRTGMALDLARGWKNKPFWVMAQPVGSENGAVPVQPGMVRLWARHALAAGAETVVFAQWRQGGPGQSAGLLKSDGTPEVGLYDVKQLVAEQAQMAEIAAEPSRAQVAMIFNYDDWWAMDLNPSQHEGTYLQLMFTWYRALLVLGIPVDFCPLGANLAGYKLVLAPTLHLGATDLAITLREYVAEGGTLVMGIRSGAKTPSNLITGDPLPGVFRHLAGVVAREGHSLSTGEEYALMSEIPGLDGAATGWAETLRPLTSVPSPNGREGEDGALPRLGEAEMLAWYGAGPFAGEAALTVHAIREGRMVYCGWQPTSRQAEAMIAYLAAARGVERVGEGREERLPSGVLAFRRGRFTGLLNFTESAQEVRVGEKWVQVPPRGVWVEMKA